MDGKTNQLQFEKLNIQVKYTAGTGIHRRLIVLANVHEQSPSDFIKSQIERAWREYVEWKVCNGTK